MIIKDLYQISNYELLKPTYNQRNIRVYSFNQVSFSGFSSHYPDILFKSDSKEKKMDNQRCLIQSLQKIFDVIPNSMTLHVLEVNQSNNTATLDGQINSISDADQLGKTLRQIKFVQQAKISQIEHLGDSNLSRVKYQLRLHCPITTA